MAPRFVLEELLIPLVHCVVPAQTSFRELARAAQRSAAVVLLDVVDTQDAARLVGELVSESPACAIGLRARVDQLAGVGELLDVLARPRVMLIVREWDGAALPELPASVDVWLELRDPIELERLPSRALAGLVVRGSECGGFTGSVSAFVLTQAALRTGRAVLVQGGIGPATAAACLHGGAVGIVVEDELFGVEGSPLRARHLPELSALGPTDTVVLGQAFGMPVRVVARPDHLAAQRLGALALELEASELEADELRTRWRRAVHAVLGWGDPATWAWPASTGLCSAAAIGRVDRRLGRYLARLRRSTAHTLELARTQPSLFEHSPFAQAWGVRLPIFQGPMTRVSDTPAFAAAVAHAGALPFLALALMRGPQARELVVEARERLGGAPLGIGILGFVPDERRDEQLDALADAPPDVAIIAGGRPDQAQRLEQAGVPSFLHAPTPTLLRLFIEQGARRFILEGSECGGHVGPLPSFALWQAAVSVLLELVEPDAEEPVDVVFAGGIHDGLSAAMVSALAAPLVARGVRVGVLMGTAYLFTHEAVESGAITPTFQTAALSCRTTRVIELARGHAIRCVPTPFVDAFESLRRTLLRREPDARRRSELLEDFTRGRARVASKHLDRRDGGELVRLEPELGAQQGMFMIGALASLQTELRSIDALHRDLIDGVAARVGQRAREHGPSARSPLDIAVIGIACQVPGAADPEQLWHNLLRGVSAVQEIPPERFDWRRYYDADVEAADGIISRWGGFVDEAPFDPSLFSLPPKSLESISTTQLWALELTRRALVDAGLDGDDYDRERTAVIMGAASPGDLQHFLIARALLPVLEPDVAEAVRERLPAWTELSQAGTLGNVTAGRVANRFDLGGKNLTLDAACASSLAALEIGVRELADHRADVAIVGAMEFELSPFTFMSFSKTRALSPTGQARVFDQHADGIVISEGGAVLILKRRADAERDGDRILGLIQGVAGSSDGQRTGITAPTVRGQQRAMQQALAEAGVGIDALGHYEAHGTGTRLGDATELDSIDGLLRATDAPASACALGSTKHLLGHTRSAAGLIGLIKALLAVRHGTLPPQCGVQRPLPALEQPDAPVALYAEATPWLSGARPRRAGVSAFGFGGSNFHAVVEEYRGARATLGGPRWPVELVLLRADTRERLLDVLATLARGLDEHRFDSLTAVARACAAMSRAVSALAPSFACVASSLAELRHALSFARDTGTGDALPSGVHLRLEPLAAAPRLALLFPGQGSQSPGMARELALVVPELRDAMARAEVELPALARLVWPPAAFDDLAAARQAEALRRTDIAQPALAAISAGLLGLLARLGVRPDAAVGHSFGELVALYAAGSITLDELTTLAVARGRVMAAAGAQTGEGGMLAITRSLAHVQALLAERPRLVVANVNAPDQVVVAGPVDALDELAERLGDAARRLPVACAFHSPAMAVARAPWREVLDTVDFRAPQIAVPRCADAAPVGTTRAQLCATLDAQLEAPVCFTAQIEALCARGCELFVEVGPGTVLGNLTRRTLGPGRGQIIALAPHPGDLSQTLDALARLALAGIALDIDALLGERDTASTAATIVPDPRPERQWWLGGGRIRRGDQAVGLVGRAPLLDEERAEAEREQLGTARAGAESPSLVAYRAYQDTMQRFLDVQEQVFGEVMQRLGGGQGDAGWTPPSELLQLTGELPQPLVEPTPELPAGDDIASSPAREPVPGPAARRISTRADVQALVLGIVSDVTGYPTDVIGLDMDIETQLGIDSIKRIEIYAAIERAMAEVGALQARLASKRRLADVIDALLDDARPQASSRPAQLLDEPPVVVRGPACPRFEMDAEREPLPLMSVASNWGRVLVLGDPHGHAGIIAARLRMEGVETHVIQSALLDDPDALGERVASLARAPLRGLIHVSALDHPLPRRDSLDSWRQRGRIHVKGLFRVLQLCEGAIEVASALHPFQVLAATGLGGRWSRDGGPALAGDPITGGIHGLLATLQTSLPNTSVRTVDFDDSGGAEWTASTIVEEFLHPEGAREVGYIRGVRRRFFARPAALTRDASPRDWWPQAGEVVLVTGGARGITGTVARSLARPGVRLVIVGRSPRPEQPAPDVLPSHAQLRQQLLDEARAAGQPPDLAQLEARVESSHAALERSWTLAQLEQAGALVEYHACDVANEHAFATLIADLYARYGRIDAVVHGAGIKADSQLAHKTLASFDEVFDTKADSAWILWRHLRPTGLRWVVLFSSIAGRFGNQGQWDYAAANEVLSRMAWHMRQDWPRTHVVAISWGPWRGGMATPALVKRFEREGIDVIASAEGLEFLHDELSFGGTAEVVAGGGPWARPDTRSYPPTLLDLLTTVLDSRSPRHDHGSTR